MSENYAREKVLPLKNLASQVADQKGMGRTVGLCHGCFDILHIGHYRHFLAAKEKCDSLIVTVTPDEFVNKGPDRPIFSAHHRAELIAGLAVVDFVGVNEWPSAVETVRLLRPDRFFKGREYAESPEEVNQNFLIEADVVREVGGEVVFTGGLVRSSTEAWKKLQLSL